MSGIHVWEEEGVHPGLLAFIIPQCAVGGARGREVRSTDSSVPVLVCIGQGEWWAVGTHPQARRV